jgi:hypothetical protein
MPEANGSQAFNLLATKTTITAKYYYDNARRWACARRTAGRQVRLNADKYGYMIK